MLNTVARNLDIVAIGVFALLVFVCWIVFTCNTIPQYSPAPLIQELTR